LSLEILCVLCHENRMNPTPAYTVLKFSGDATETPESMRSVIDFIAIKAKSTPVAVVVAALGHSTDILLEAIDFAENADYRSADKNVDLMADTVCSVGTRTLEMLQDGTRQKMAINRMSAMVGEILDPLRRLLYGVSLLRQASAQTKDLVISFAERLNARVVAELLAASDCDALYVDSRDWTVTDATFSKALVDWDATQERVRTLQPQWEGRITVHPGLLGRTRDNRTTTLGRHGGDYTATLLARALQASEVVISTNVGGVMTADPALVSDAYPIARLTYMEALELANFSTHIFHPSTMIPLIASGIPLRIKHTSAAIGTGTVIDATGSDETRQPTAIATLENTAMISVEWRALTRPANVAARVLDALDVSGVTVWMANQAAHGQSVTAVVPEAQVDKAQAAIEEALQVEASRGEVAPVAVHRGFTLLTLVAGAMGRTPNVAGRLFATLGGMGVMIRAIAQSATARSISCVIDSSETRRATQEVHRSFNMSQSDSGKPLF